MATDKENTTVKKVSTSKTTTTKSTQPSKTSKESSTSSASKVNTAKVEKASTVKSDTAKDTTKKVAASKGKTTANNTSSDSKTKEATIKQDVKKVTTNKKASKGNKKAEFVSRLETKYKDEIVPQLMKEFNYASIMECPKLVKVILNMRLGDAGGNDKNVQAAVKDMEIISGQHPIVIKAKKSVANFKLREGTPVAVKVTLRRIRMYDFLDKLIAIDLPRQRDFRGVSKSSFDGRGNYSLGIKEQLIFPEIQYDKVVRNQGMDVIIVTTCKTDKEAFRFMQLLGMPFSK